MSYLIPADSDENVAKIKQIASRFPKCPIPVVAIRLIKGMTVNKNEAFAIDGKMVEYHLQNNNVRLLGFPNAYENPTDNDSDMKRVKAEAFVYAKSLVTPPAPAPAPVEAAPKK